ncbi:MAG: PSD1 and planctomycete cytochrome C domain-containing protein [Verrucomicrobiales bacterium]|nr:PSD1 and planctomycete cytochrome C domain-containing protein [Verrucomicrobiales bacterium]
MNSLRFAFLSAVLLPGWIGVAHAEITPEQRKYFETKIRPVLAKECYECHSAGAKKVGGKLLLDTTAGLKRGGESGSPMVPGKPEDSLLVHALKWLDDLEMPPENPLPANVIADFEKWIAMGAPVPPDVEQAVVKGGVTEPKKYKPGELWSFQPVKDPPVPESKSEWARSAIDQFAFRKMAEKNLEPASDAPPKTLVRRLYFDLIGLPPTFAESNAFVADYGKRGQAAVAALVDELLASPHFGERWGRHWLDVARYAESNGNDGLSRNASFPNAWRYRDYVIDALNRDVPYDRFIAEQIAGDLLEAETDQERDRQLVATGFLALGAKPAKAMNNNFEMDIVADQIEVVTSGIIGLSVGCARCHDHKFDPIPTRDYYAMAGFFTSSETLYGIAANEKLTAPPTPLHVLKTPPKVPAPPEALKLMEETEKLEMRNYPRPKEEHTYPPGTPVAMGVRDRKEPADCKINLKGDAQKPGEVVPRGVLTAYPDKTLGELTIDPSGSGRRELAKWLTDKKHPQTSRVMVNRIWLHLFGKAIVGTPDDFGVYGEKPTHPELLDHLAARFSGDHDWSIKSMIHEIVLSRTYQLDSHASPESIAADPENIWVSRHTRRRLDAESIRDAILKVTGNLNPEPADGSPIRHLDILVNRAPDLHQPSNHRSIYLCFMRNSPPRELAAFDLPDGLTVTGKRDETMLPTQGLFLLNSPFIKNQADYLARSSGDNVREMWRRVLNREPSQTELAGARYLLENTEPEERAWPVLAQALLATNEFRYVD